MRRKDREVQDLDQIAEIMDNCQVCRIAMWNDNGYPYIVPMNFGLKYENGRMELYFHGAGQGRKLELLRADNRAAFEMDRGHKLITNESPCDFTMEYESVVGYGPVDFLEGEEKRRALDVITRHYSRDVKLEYGAAMLNAMAVYRLKVESVTAKRLKK